MPQAAAPPREPAVRRNPLAALFLAVFIDLLGFGLFIPSLAYMAGRYGATDTQIGLLQTSFSLTQFIFAPFWGWLSDRIGRRRVLLITITGGGFAYLAFGSAGSLLTLFVARAAAGAFGANITAAQAYVADVTTPENRARGMGVVGAAMGLGFTLGPPIGGLLAGGTHFEWPAYLAAALCFVNLAMAAVSLPESKPVPSAGPPHVGRFRILLDALVTPRLSSLIVIYFVVTFAFANVEQALILATWRKFQWGPRENGELLGLAGVLIVVMQGRLLGPLSRRFGERRLLGAGTVSMAAGLLVLALSDVPAGYWLAMFPLALGNGLSNPSLTSLVSRAAPAAWRGSAIGVAASSGSLARIVAPMWAGWSFEHLAFGAPFVTGAAVMAIGTVLVVALPAETAGGVVPAA